MITILGVHLMMLRMMKLHDLSGNGWFKSLAKLAREHDSTTVLDNG
jgi:hypothetical protein